MADLPEELLGTPVQQGQGQGGNFRSSVQQLAGNDPAQQFYAELMAIGDDQGVLEDGAKMANGMPPSSSGADLPRTISTEELRRLVTLYGTIPKPRNIPKEIEGWLKHQVELNPELSKKQASLHSKKKGKK